MPRSDHGKIEKACAVALAMMIIAPASVAQTDTVNRARVGFASISFAFPDGRQCWARYGTAAGQTRTGVIEEVAFRVPCPELISRTFLEMLQRALMARGFHNGPVTGVADTQTRAAVHAFQKANGFNSPILTLDTAQRLGLLPIKVTRN